MSNGVLARVFSPLVFFVAHLVYLVTWSQEPFLNKWIDGCFTFFVSLVLCNIIRSRLASAAEPEDPGDVGGPPRDRPKIDHTP